MKSGMYIVLFALLFGLIKTQSDNKQHVVYFPSDNGGVALAEKSFEVIPPNLSEIRGTTVYENYVDKIISMGIGKMTLELNKLLVSSSENVVFSPTSIASALALVLLGANGRTFNELTDFMGLATGVLDIHSKSQLVHEQFGRILQKLIATSGFNIGQEITFASAVFVNDNYPIRPLYIQTAEEIYRSEVLNVDFQQNPTLAQSVINEWVSQHTRGKINNILASAPLRDTRVIIATALYFKAEWENKFFAKATARRPFFPNGRKSPSNMEAEMMANGGYFPYHRDVALGCEVMGFPYKGNASTMYVIMPFNSNKEKLKELEDKLTILELNRLVDSTVYTDSLVLFPKMKLESTIDLRDSLEQLGVRSLFDPKEANLALLSAGELPSRFKADIKTANCSKNVTSCGDNQPEQKQNETLAERKEEIKFDVRIGSGKPYETLDYIRQLINQQSTSNDYQNPRLYADQIVHKVYMDITETGTEAAAATSVSISKSGGRVTFRVDVPFFFFIRHESTKTIFFWGSVIAPTPNFSV